MTNQRSPAGAPQPTNCTQGEPPTQIQQFSCGINSNLFTVEYRGVRLKSIHQVILALGSIEALDALVLRGTVQVAPTTPARLDADGIPITPWIGASLEGAGGGVAGGALHAADGQGPGIGGLGPVAAGAEIVDHALIDA